MTSAGSPAKAVIWDMDGVISDTAPCHLQSWQKVMARRGVRVTAAAFRRTFGQRNDIIIGTLLGGRASPEEIEAIAREKEAVFRRIARDRLRPLPGVGPLLESLRRGGYRLALASSAPMANISFIVRKLGIAGCFDALVSGEDVTEGKPNPQVFLVAAMRLGVDPARCLVIEDAVAGVAAARKAGMFCLAVTNTHPAARLREADLVVASLTEVSTADIEAIFHKPKGVAG